MDTEPPSRSDAPTANVKDWPTLNAWKPIWLEKTGGLFSATLTNRVVTMLAPLASLVVRLTMKTPGAAYVWVARIPLSSGEPSPKFQLQTRLPTPPVDICAKLTGTPASAGLRLAMAVTASLELTTRACVDVVV